MQITRPFLTTTSVLLLAIAASLSLTAQQTGTINGRVVDAASGDPVIGAVVRVDGVPRIGATSNVSGNFSIRNVPVGTVSISISSVGHGSKTIEGIAVRAGEITRQDVSLATRAVKGETVTIRAAAGRGTDNAALIERKRSTTVSDAISSQEIARAPASDAGDAMKRVTGVSVVGDKYVVVRGLSERYSSTQLNGVNLPSPEPEKKVVPFDMFPSSMISRLTTIKTFTPDNPGDFAGGLVKITTKEFPESFLLTFSAGTGTNSQTQGTSALGYAGGATDYLGIDDGTRRLPTGLAAGHRQSAGTQADLLGRFTNTVYSPAAADLPFNQAYNLTIGNRFDVGIPLGFLVGASYSGSANYREEKQSYPLLEELSNGRRALRYDYDVRRAERSVLWGGLLNVSAQLSPEHKIGFKGVLNHSSDDETRNVNGFYSQSSVGEIRYSRLRFVERTLGSMQLDGESQFESLLGSRLEWRGAISTAHRSEPDNRSITYFRSSGDSNFYFANNFGSNNGRFFSDLADTEKNAGFDLTIPVPLWEAALSRIKIGGLARFRDRDFGARRFLYGTGRSELDRLVQAPEDLFTRENVLSGLVTFNDETLASDRYTASEQVIAGYGMIDIPVTAALRFIGGVRVEQWKLDLFSPSPVSGERDSALDAERDVLDLLPSLNLVYALDDAMNLRASFSQTLARPEFRELAPFRFDDYRQSTYGNPSLVPTKVINLDLRWEWFPGSGEVLATSAFYKRFTNPIEQFYLVGGSGISAEPANASNAMTYGVELEFRRGLEFLSPSLEQFSVGTNLTMVKSEVSFTEGEAVQIFDGLGISPFSAEVLTSRNRPLQGQSPYVVNASLGYDNRESGTNANVLYNIFGRRLAIVGTEGIPDTYEQPRGALDLSISQRLPAGLQLRLTARNLLDAENILRQEFSDGETIDIERYRTGRTISLGITYAIE
jgi:outer membrane receptor protein involved in Fe transport